MIQIRTLLPRLSAVAAAVTLGLLSTGVVADSDGFVGPDWVEDGKGDAGNTLSTAQAVRGNGGGVNHITGAVTGGGGGGFARGLGDFQDIYLIFIEDPNDFEASTVPPSGEATFNTRLSLFRLDGTGLLFADDAAPGVPQTTLSNTSTSGDSKIDRPGVYGLAIFGAPTVPFALGDVAIFPPAEAGATVGPTAIGANRPLAGWQPAVGQTGTYRIRVGGVRLIPAKCGENGSCFDPHPEPGCDDLDCCSRVCQVDPLCCDAEWDIQCANIARGICTGCGAPQSGPCGQPHPSPFCDDAECCDTVCAVDPFCCIDAWDASCVKLAIQTCHPPCPECLADFNQDGLRDGADLGLMLGAWGDPGCTDLNGDGLTDGADLGLLLGVLGPCSACGDPDSGGCLFPHPGPGCADLSCCETVCLVDPACCAGDWDQSCAEQARQICAPGCGDPDAGPCLVEHLSPGCSDAACCSVVCDVLPRCCEIAWDSLCVEFASRQDVCGN
jgi:hypothetical protein